MALSTPPVASVAVPNVFPVLASVIVPFVVVTFKAPAWIAPLCPIVLPPDNVSVPPILAAAIVSAEAS